MKKFITLLIIILLIGSPLNAQGLKLCPTESGVLTFYDFTTHSFYLGTRYPLVDWRELVYLDCVVITNFSSLNGGLGLSADVLKAWKMAGLNVHLSDKLNVGTLGGYNAGRERWYWGAYVGVKLDW